jgi:hypothetical protein
MRASTGNAVMLIAIPMNSENARNETAAGANCLYIKYETTTPRKKGKIMLA